MKITSKTFWDTILAKIIITLTSVKIWVLVWTFFIVLELYKVAAEVRAFMFLYPTNIELIKILTDFQAKLYDISNAVLLGVVVVIVLSRESIKYTKMKQEESMKEVKKG